MYCVCVVDVMMVSRALRLYNAEWQEAVNAFFLIHHLKNWGSSSNCTQENMFSTGIFSWKLKTARTSLDV